MAGVGVDLLDIARLERALERRPRLAERLFTDAERAYAARRPRPGTPPGRAVLREGGRGEGARPRAWSFRDVEVVATDGPPELRLSGAAAARAEELGSAPSVAHPHRHDGGRGRAAAVSLPGWLDPLYEAAEMRAVDAWAIEERGVPSLDLMERAGLGLARVTAAAARRGPDPHRDRQGQQRRRRAGGRAPAARGGPRGRRALDGAARRAAAATPGRTSSGCPGDGPSRSTPSRLEGSGAVRRRAARHRLRGRAARAGRPARSPRSTTPARRSWPATCPAGVNASTGEIEGEAVRAAARPPRSTRRRSACTWHPGSASTPAWSRSSRSASRAAPRRRRGGADHATRVLGLVPARARARARSSRRASSWWSGGSRGLTGAPAMAALAAQRAGAGYVQVAVPASVEPALDMRLLEAMTPRAARRRRRPHRRRASETWRRWPSAPARSCSAPGSAARTARRSSRARWPARSRPRC